MHELVIQKDTDLTSPTSLGFPGPEKTEEIIYNSFNFMA